MLVALKLGDYITGEQVNEAQQRLDEDAEAELKGNTIRGMLDWLIAEGYTDQETEASATGRLMEERFDDINAQVSLLFLLRELDPLRFEKRAEALIGMALKEQKRKQRLFSAGAFAVLIVIGAYMLWPASTPSCGASNTVKAVGSIMIRARIDATLKNPILMTDTDSQSHPRVSNYREIGYDEGTRSRGCVADLAVADEKTAIGYVIRPDEKSKSDYAVQMFPSGYVTARYDAKGLNKKLGAPLGREAISASFMAGVARLDADLATISPNYGKPLLDHGEPSTKANSILGVVPAADCRRIDGDHVSCPLLIDYRDDLLEAIGVISLLQLKGDFVFVKDGSGWKTSDDFPKTLTQAIVERRIATVYGDAAADKLGVGQ